LKYRKKRGAFPEPNAFSSFLVGSFAGVVLGCQGEMVDSMGIDLEDYMKPAPQISSSFLIQLQNHSQSKGNIKTHLQELHRNKVKHRQPQSKSLRQRLKVKMKMNILELMRADWSTRSIFYSKSR
jgi:hypothetical protein